MPCMPLIPTRRGKGNSKRKNYLLPTQNLSLQGFESFCIIWFCFPAKNTHKTSDYNQKLYIFSNIEMVLRKLHFASSVLLHCLKKKSAISCALCVIKITRKNICFILRNRAHLKSKAKMSPTSGDWAWKPSVAVELTLDISKCWEGIMG